VKPLIILAPYPKQELLLDGWFRRIAQIEKCLLGLPRIYIRIDKNHLGNAIYYRKLSTEIIEISWNPDNSAQTHEVAKLINPSKVLYCHTTHYAEYIHKLEFDGKIILDMHGAAPEEELLNGNLQTSNILSKVESEIVNSCDLLIVVSNAMSNHLRNKNLSPRKTYKVSISAAFFPQNRNAVLGRLREIDYIYAGGVQPWQNLDMVINFLDHNIEYSAVIATNSPGNRIFKSLRKSIKIGSFEGAELSQLYLRSHLGFALRDDSLVNQVASPTKILEYICHGVIPVLKNSKIGDLENMGIRYIDFEKMRNKVTFDLNSFTEMREHNFNLAIIHHSTLITEMMELRKLIWEWMKC
jgi:hypothetical protein